MLTAGSLAEQKVGVPFEGFSTMDWQIHLNNCKWVQSTPVKNTVKECGIVTTLPSPDIVSDFKNFRNK